ncbi:hypothetical protein GI582_22810 [Sulfitobacter sp. BDSS02]|nr:hypothetical protein [Sulfitobacter sp. BDSS02]
MKRRALKFGGWLVFILSLTELMLRWGLGLGDPPLAKLDPLTEYELIGPAEYRRWHNRISINTHGMRAPDHAPLPGPEERRILLIGDSVVYGGHFLDQSETISSQMEALLAGSPWVVGCEVLVLPMAVSSWGPVNQAAFLKREGTFGALVAGMLVSGHDLYDLPQAQPNILPYRTNPPFGALGDAVEAVAERFIVPLQLPPLQWRTRQEIAAASLAALTRSLDQLRGEGASVILIYHPTVQERRGAAYEARDVFANWASERNVPFLDLRQEISDVSGYRDTIHPDAAGAVRIAEVLANRMGPMLDTCST